jgi:hypothetical protein
VGELHSLEEFLSSANKAGCIDTERLQYAEPNIDCRGKKDFWGRLFRWETRHEGSDLIIRVISDGADGIPQKGGGDDLYVQVVIPAQGKPRVFEKTINARGQMQTRLIEK